MKVSAITVHAYMCMPISMSCVLLLNRCINWKEGEHIRCTVGLERMQHRHAYVCALQTASAKVLDLVR